MTYMAFATLMQDPGADMAAAKDLAERKYGEQGSSRTGVSTVYKQCCVHVDG